ncbi:MAG: DMT family transporter [Acidiferrobacterales bacterium]
MATISNHLRGVTLATAGALIISPDALILRLITTDHWTVLFWRGLLTALTLAVLFVVTYPRTFVQYVRVIGGLGMLAAFLLAVTSILFVTSITLTTAANTLVIISVAPLLAAILSFVFLREHVPFRTWIAILAALAGIAMIFSGNLGGGALLGDLCALATAFFLAAHLTVVRRARANDMLPAVAISGIIVAIACVPIAKPLAVTTPDIALLAVLGMVVLPLAFSLFVRAPRFIPAAEVGLIMLLEAILGPLWVWLAINEIPNAATFVGGGAVLATLIVHSVLALRAPSAT